MACFELLSWHLPGQTEGNHEELQDSMSLAGILKMLKWKELSWGTDQLLGMVDNFHQISLYINLVLCCLSSYWLAVDLVSGWGLIPGRGRDFSFHYVS